MEGGRIPLILVLDTTALWDRSLLEMLGRASARGLQERGALEAVLPAVAYAERIRQLRRDGQSERTWMAQLGTSGIRIEAFGREEADRLPEAPVDDDAWAGRSRDFLISRHVHGERIAVTEDAGPPWSGLRRLAPGAAAEAIRSLLEAG